MGGALRTSDRMRGSTTWSTVAPLWSRPHAPDAALLVHGGRRTTMTRIQICRLVFKLAVRRECMA